jgi:hypothetical protein
VLAKYVFAAPTSGVDFESQKVAKEGGKAPVEISAAESSFSVRQA